MGTPSVMKKVGDTAKTYWGGLKSLTPTDSDVAGLKAVQDNVNGKGISNGQPELTEKSTASTSPADKVDPMAKFGSRPGEVRLDSEGNVQKEQPAKVYDKGGDVDVSDGKHEMAILQDGEKVLTPEQAKEYDATKGAPADFGGRVMSNPKGLKPTLDTEIPAHEPDKLAGQAKMDINNAPSKTPEGNIANAAAGNPAMSPLGKPKGAEQQDPHVTEAAGKEYGMGQPEESPEVRGSDAERKAIEVDKKNAMGSGDLVKLGTALLNERHLSPMKSMEGEPKVYDNGGDVVVGENKLDAPPEFNQGYRKMADIAPEHGVEAAAQQGEPKAEQKPEGLAPMRNLGQPEASAQPEQSAQPTQPAQASAPAQPVDPKEAYKAKLAAYDKQIQASLDEATPEGKETADRTALAKQVFESKNPWGTPGNHPGFMGKLGHVAAKVGNIAGDVFAPKTMELIPGTQLNKQVQAGATERNIATDVAAEAKVNKPGVEPSYKPLDHPMVNPKTGKPEEAFVNEKDPNDVKFKGDFITKPGESKEDDQTAWVNQSLKDKNLPDTAANRKDLIGEYSAAHQAPTLMEHKNPDGSITYEAAKAGTTVAAPEGKVGSNVAEENKFKGKTLVFNNNDGTREAMSYEDAKKQGKDIENADVYTGPAADKLREKANSYDSATHAFTKYEKDVNSTNLSGDDVRAMQVITSHLPDGANDYAAKVASGIFDSLMGEPLTGYSEKAMGGMMTKDQYNKLSPAGRQVMSDYFNAMLAHFASMKAQQGSIPRNPMMIQTEMNAIPLPYLDREQAKPAFENYTDRLERLNAGTVTFKGKTKTEEKPTTKEAAPTAPAAGAVEGGYRFKGGDASNPDNWERVTGQ